MTVSSGAGSGRGSWEISPDTMSVANDLVVLHGALGAIAQFGALIARLQGSVRIHTLDFEGHGNAPPRGRPFRIRHFADNVVEVLDRERILCADFFGYSMGGYVALQLALQAPHRVGRGGDRRERSAPGRVVARVA